MKKNNNDNEDVSFATIIECHPRQLNSVPMSNQILVDI